MLSSSCSNFSPFQAGRGEEELSEITFHGPGHYVLLPQFSLRMMPEMQGAHMVAMGSALKLLSFPLSPPYCMSWLFL